MKMVVRQEMELVISPLYLLSQTHQRPHTNNYWPLSGFSRVVLNNKVTGRKLKVQEQSIDKE
jgi:hypothetical protein